MKEILVVDDDCDCLVLVRLILEQAGMTVHCAASGEEVLPQIANESFSLMITDLNMPRLNGLELARKALAIAPCMPVVLVSGDITAEIPSMAAEAGIVKILAKPFHPEELLETVRSLVVRGA